MTTASLEALQLYSNAMLLGFQFKWEPAARLLEAAVVRDPQFASAHILLAYALANTGRPVAQVLEQAERARPPDRLQPRFDSPMPLLRARQPKPSIGGARWGFTSCRCT